MSCEPFKAPGKWWELEDMPSVQPGVKPSSMLSIQKLVEIENPCAPPRLGEVAVVTLVRHEDVHPNRKLKWSEGFGVPSR